MLNFLLGEFISRLNIANRGHFKSIYVNNINIALNLLELFEWLGIIEGFFILNDKKIEVFMKQARINRFAFKNIKLISTPGKRVYVSLKQLYMLKDKVGKNVVYILSTDEGLMFDVECIKKRKSGEVLLLINV